METIDRYLRTARWFLPKERQDDIVRELGASLSSQMDARQAELGRPLTRAEQKAVLKRHGAPMLVARAYWPDDPGLSFGRQLISPMLFPLYVAVAGTTAALRVAIYVIYALVTREPISALWVLFNLLLQVGIITLVFVLLDRSQRQALQPPHLLAPYLQAVAKHLPAKQRDDIVKELEENLQSQIDDREAALGRPLTVAEQESLLKQHGHPLLVAGRYRADQRSLAFGRQLIGPVLFPFYLKILKLNVGITAAVVLIAAFAFAGRQPILQTVQALFFHVSLQVAIVTLIFSLAESSLTRFPDRWVPRRPSRQPALADATRVPRLGSIFELIVGVIVILWWLSVPRYLRSTFPPGSAFLQAGPGWRALYLPLLLLAPAGMVQPLVNLVRPRWTRFRAAARTVTTGLFLLVLGFSLGAGNWVVLASAADPLAAHQRTVAVVNTWCGISIEIGMLIGAVVLVLEARLWVRRRQAESAPSSD
jgi:hypothetical protein